VRLRSGCIASDCRPGGADAGSRPETFLQDSRGARRRWNNAEPKTWRWCWIKAVSARISGGFGWPPRAEAEPDPEIYRLAASGWGR